jgi:hypothetical protein
VSVGLEEGSAKVLRMFQSVRKEGPDIEKWYQKRRDIKEADKKLMRWKSTIIHWEVLIRTK